MTTERLEVVIDLARSVEDIGEIVKLGASLGFTCVVERDDPEADLHELGYRIRLVRDARVWGTVEIVNLAVLAAYVYGRSGNDQVADIQRALVSIGLPMERALQDVVSLTPPSDLGPPE